MCYLPLLPYICIKQNYNEIQKSNDAEQISYVAAHGITGRVCTVLVGEVERPPSLRQTSRIRGQGSCPLSRSPRYKLSR